MIDLREIEESGGEAIVLRPDGLSYVLSNGKIRRQQSLCFVEVRLLCGLIACSLGSLPGSRVIRMLERRSGRGSTRSNTAIDVNRFMVIEFRERRLCLRRRKLD